MREDPAKDGQHQRSLVLCWHSLVDFVRLPASRGRLHTSAMTNRNLQLLGRRRTHPPLVQLPLPHRLPHPSPSLKFSPNQRYLRLSSQSTHSHVSDSFSRVHNAHSSSLVAIPVPFATTSARTPSLTWQSVGMHQAALFYPPETTLGSEFSVLSDFLESLDERSFFNPPPATVTPALMSAPPQTFPTPPQPTEPSPSSSMEQYTNPDITVTEVSPPAVAPVKEETVPVVLPSATKAEKFLMIAADQEPGPRNERLNRVIRSKYEAGLLKPYNYVKGYARLQRWMESKCVLVRCCLLSACGVNKFRPHLASPRSRSRRFCNRSRFCDPSSECVGSETSGQHWLTRPAGNRSVSYRYRFGVH